MDIIVLLVETNTCWNDAGAMCDFPFEYKGNLYNKCTKAGGYCTSWCYDKRVKGYWDYCTTCAECTQGQIFNQ